MIIGKLIPAATGLRRYRRLEIEPTEPIARPSPEEMGLLDEAELAQELGLTGDGDLGDFGFGDGTATARPSPTSSPTWRCRREGDGDDK